MKVFFRVALLAVVLTISGCTQVRTEGDTVVIANSVVTLLGLGGLGIFLVVMGVLVVVEALKKISTGRKKKKKRKSGSGIGGIVIGFLLGGVFTILGLAFALYAAPAAYFSTIVLEKDKLINKASWGWAARPPKEYPYSSINYLAVEVEERLGRKLKTQKKEYVVIRTAGGVEDRMEMNSLWRAALPLLKEIVRAENPEATITE